MSTRAMYEFKDDSGKRTVYVHHDGYPTGAAEKFSATLKSGLAWELPRFEADEFAAAFIAANKKQAGSVRLLHGPEEATDIEYYYIVSQSGTDELILEACSATFDKAYKFIPVQFYKGALDAFIKNVKKIEARLNKQAA